MRAHILCAAILAAVHAVTPLAPSQAETKKPAPFPEFSAKRVKPPKSGTRKRITVQIAPQPVAAPAIAGGAAPAPGGRATGAGSYAWFWEAVSPKLDASGPGRLEPALQSLAGAGHPVSAPRLQSLQEIARARGADILHASVSAQVSPALILAVISVESGGRADAVSGAGAQGLMQLMPATAERFGVTDPFDAAQNIRGGTAYLSWLLARFDGDPILALAGYNAGENAVSGKGGVPDYAETRDYVPKVLAAFAVARGLCLTPPQLVTDGCVFVGMDS